MKRLLIVFATAGFLTACTNAGTPKKAEDSVIKSIETEKAEKIDSIKDTTAKKKEQVEATFEKTDSANRALNKPAKK